MSDTPRTDAQRYDCEYRGDMGCKFTADKGNPDPYGDHVDAEFARQLERENAELLEALKLLSSHGHADDCLLINRAGESCDCGLDYACEIIAKAKGVQP